MRSADAAGTSSRRPAADRHPDGVFVEDAVVIFDDLAVLTRPGAESRRGEVANRCARVVEGLGVEVASIEAPGTLEGGDVLKVGRTAYVGRELAHERRRHRAAAGAPGAARMDGRARCP